MAHAGAFQLGARFLPELNAISAGLAGATKLSMVRFGFYGLVSALMWAVGWIGLGYVLSSAVTETAARLGVRLIVFFLAPFALFLLFHRARRHRVIRLFRRARTSPDVLSTALEKGDRMATFDPPSAEERKDARPWSTREEQGHSPMPLRAEAEGAMSHACTSEGDLR
ncbi:MAG TPA: hypothetical protein VEL48_02905 [Candidatus Acidoferrales bacterium]|nr:hypothetical protein [Candidatus Acidoferrales bacterium]